MADINRLASPMDLLDENIGEAPEKIRSRKKFLLEKQQTKSPLLIGSIEELSRRISQLDSSLQNYVELVCESRVSNVADSIKKPNSAWRRDLYQQRQKEHKELCTFAEFYNQNATLTPDLSKRAKTISESSTKSQVHQTIVVSKEISGKPKLAELHVYPGYNHQKPTDLANGLKPVDIFVKVIEASVHLIKKPRYKSTFEPLFLSPMSQAIFLDLFWYIFLEKFQQDKKCQRNLFDRTAENYVNLLMSSSNYVLRDTFFKEYPKLMSQAVYSSFCFSFPDSYGQFGERFKDDLVFLVYGWMAGIRPTPRVWMTWDITSLEPPNLKQREEMMNRKNNKKGKSLINFEFLDSLISANTSQTTSTRTRSLSQSTRSSAASGSVTKNSNGHLRISKVTKQPFGHSTLKKSDTSILSQDDIDKRVLTDTREASSDLRGLIKPNRAACQASKTLTTIREMKSEDVDAEQDMKSSQVSDYHIRKNPHKPDQEVRSICSTRL